MEHLHNLVTINHRLQQAHVVLLLQVGQLFAHHAEVLKEHFFAHLVLRGDISLAQGHQVLDILTRIVHQSTYGRIGHNLIGNHDGTHVHIYQLLHVLHLHVEWQHEATEYLRHHLGTNHIMIVEGPADSCIPTFRLGFTHIVQQGCPAQPQVVGVHSHIIQHLEGVVEVILVCTTVLLLYDIECRQFGQDDIEQTATLQIYKTTRWCLRKNNLVKLVLDTLAAHNLDSVGHALQGHKGFLLNLEVKLCGKTDASHHAQGIIAKGDAWLQRGSNDTILQVGQAIKRVDQLAKTLLVQADGHGIDSKVATVLIVLQRSVFDNRFTGVVTVALLTSSHKLHLVFGTLLPEFHLGSTKVLKYAKMCFLAYDALEFLGHLDAAANYHHIDIVRRTFQEYVAYISAHHIALQTQSICSLAYLVEDVLI